MNPQKKRKRGGQPKAPSERKRNNLTIRVLDRLRDRLEAAAHASGRSVSEEAAHRMTVSFALETELKDVAEIRQETDDTIKAVMHRRHWGKVVDPRYGGPVWIPPGQLPLLPRSGFIDPPNTPAPPAIAPELEAALERVVERAVAKALARAKLTIGAEGK
jgi:hypothetical protein